MGAIVDTSVFIAFERGLLDFNNPPARLENENFHISVVTASELLHGVHRASNDMIRLRRREAVESWLSLLPLVDIDLAVARVHAQIGAALAASGFHADTHDNWIAATCLARGWKIMTLNVRDFERIPGLVVETWSEV